MTVSLLGDGIYFVTIAWQVYDLSNAPTALSVVGVAWTAPQIAFLLLGGIVSDRFDRRKVMIVADVVRGLAIAAIGAFSVAGALELWHLFLLVAIYGAGEALFVPAFSAIVPDLVPEHLLVEANSLDMLVRPLTARLLGPVLGGVAIAALGPGGAFLFDAGTFVVSALAIAAVRARPLPRRGGASALRDVAEGFRFVRAHTWLGGTLLAAAVALLFHFGPWQVLVPYLVRNLLDGSAGDLGLVLGAGGLGAIGAALVTGQRRLPRRQITFMYAVWAISGATVAAYGVATALWQAMLAAFLSGGLSTAGTIVWLTLVQTRVPRELLGRVSSFDWLVSIGLVPVSFALTGPIAEAVGVRETLVGAGILSAVITLAFLFLPGMRDPEREHRADAAYDPAS